MTRLRYFQFLFIVLLLAPILVPSLPMIVHGYNCPAQCRYVHPGESIQHAINTASVNDTIFVSLGSYTERFLLNKTVHLVGGGIAMTIVDGQAQGTVVTVTASNASITGFTIQNSGADGSAVQVLRANNVNITSNGLSSDVSSARSSGAGVDLFLSNHTIIDSNVFTYNLFAVNITSSTFNRVSNNRFLNRDLVGVEMTGSSHNTVFQNSFVTGEAGVDMEGSLTAHNNVTRNLIRQMSIAGVFLVDFPSGNIFNENNFELNHIGVDIQNSTGNIFYHDAFFRSGFRHVNHVVPSDIPLNTWDNHTLGAPVPGGNYWDNYTGVDNNGDGIGDTNLPANGLDHYPLMVPFVPVPIAVASVMPSKVSGPVPFTVSFSADVLGTLKPFVYAWSFGDNTQASSETSPSHTYTAVGDYSVSVFVRDASGTTSVGTVTISALPPASPGSGLGYLPLVAVLALGATVFGVLYYRRRRRLGNTAVDPIVPKASGKAKSLGRYVPGLKLGFSKSCGPGSIASAFLSFG